MSRLLNRPALLGLALLLVGGCTTGFHTVRERPGSAAATTGGPWTSMVYAGWTAEGVVVVDLGWERGRHLRRILAEIGATPEDVVAVFLTHSHRDHIAAWPTVRHARFHMGEAEVPYFVGSRRHQGTMSRLASVIEPNRPDPEELDIRPFAGDTTFTFGADTVRAFSVPGHTPGSAAYLFQGLVFAGDALSHTRGRGFHSARGLYSQDAELARRSLEALWVRLSRFAPVTVCTAHAMCIPFRELLTGWEWENGEPAIGLPQAR